MCRQHILEMPDNILQERALPNSILMLVHMPFTSANAAAHLCCGSGEGGGALVHRSGHARQACLNVVARFLSLLRQSLHLAAAFLQCMTRQDIALLWCGVCLGCSRDSPAVQLETVPGGGVSCAATSL